MASEHLELTTLDTFTIAHRGTFHVVELPDDYDNDLTRRLIGKTVILDGAPVTVRSVEIPVIRHHTSLLVKTAETGPGMTDETPYVDIPEDEARELLAGPFAPPTAEGDTVKVRRAQDGGIRFEVTKAAPVPTGATLRVVPDGLETSGTPVGYTVWFEEVSEHAENGPTVDS